MPSSLPPVPTSEPEASNVRPIRDGIFEKKLAKRLRSAQTSPDSLISESAKAVLSAEKTLLEARAIIDELVGRMENQRAPESEVKNDSPQPHGFRPIVYSHREAVLSDDEDIGLDIITADQDGDERVCMDFGFDDAPKGEPDEWDILYDRIQSLKLLDQISETTVSRDIGKLAEKLRQDPNFHLGKGGKKGKD